MQVETKPALAVPAGKRPFLEQFREVAQPTSGLPNSFSDGVFRSPIRRLFAFSYLPVGVLSVFGRLLPCSVVISLRK